MLFFCRNYWALFNADLNSMVDVYVPDTDSPVTTPIIYMVGGLGGLMPGIGYATIHTRYTSVYFIKEY